MFSRFLSRPLWIDGGRMADMREKWAQWTYYARHAALATFPDRWFRARRDRILRRLDSYDRPALRDRVDYYLEGHEPFQLGDDAVPFRLDLFGGRTVYQLDLYEHLRYFDRRYRLAWQFGDATGVPSQRALVKSRPLDAPRATAVLFKLNTLRHYRFVHDRRPYTQKKDKLVWRGHAAQPQRKEFLRRYIDHPDCDVGHYHRQPCDGPWARPRLSIAEQLDYRFILSMEGNDVATSLKWILSSRSLCFMCRPRYETWFMEGRLAPNVHYVELQPDYADLPDKLAYYRRHDEEAQSIIRAANDWVAPFRDRRRERVIALLVLWKYFHLSGQCEAPPL